MKKLLTLLLAILISLIIIVPIYSECPDHEGGDHVYDQEKLVSEATCTSPAMYIKKCSCGESDPSGAYEVGSPLGHNWVDTEITAATCTSAAIHANVCSRCGYVDESSKHSSGEPSAHNWVDTEISPKTCTEKAVHADKCSVCGAEREGSRQSVGELAEHTWVDTEISAASCTSAAVHADICSVCKTEKENSRHTVGDPVHDYVETELVPATCTQPAIYAEVCTKCGTEKSGSQHYVGSATGHSPTNKSNKYLKSSATCSSSAVYYYECATCGAKCEETYEFGSPKGHSYDSWTEVDENTHSHKCTSCGHSETESHEWGEGKVVEKPTETETGITEYTCKKCGAKKTEITDKVSVDNIPKPTIDVESRHYVYTGSPITFEVPDSNFYTAKNNVQINAGEYEVEVVLNKDNYLWEDGSNKNLKFTFVIEKADYDMSQVIFEDKAYIADGNSYSLEATNLPDGVSVAYSVSDIWEPGTYEVVASFVGDDNHNEIADMKAKLYILEVSENEIIGDGGSIIGIPNDVNFEVRELVEGDIEYISAKDAVISDFGIKEKDILGVVDLSLDFKGLVVEPNGSVTVTLYPSVANDEEFDLYHVHTDEFGNTFCEYVDYVLNADGTITFTLDTFSQIVFVKVTKSPLILIIIIIDIIALIALSAYIIIRRSKKNKDKVNEVKDD
ncbi:MAG: hypothetical protein Q4E33_05630, partial [Erysipelotrichaceae bacterium]|nr:hypothetical protein [Erysipelotrichaceae bacterium]